MKKKKVPQWAVDECEKTVYKKLQLKEDSIHLVEDRTGYNLDEITVRIVFINSVGTSFVFYDVFLHEKKKEVLQYNFEVEL